MRLSKHLAALLISTAAFASVTVSASSQESEMRDADTSMSESPLQTAALALGSSTPSTAIMNQIQPPRMMGFAKDDEDTPVVAVGPLTGSRLSQSGTKRKDKGRRHSRRRGHRHRRRYKPAHIFRTALYLIPLTADVEARGATTRASKGVIVAGIIYTHTHALLYLHNGKDDLDAFNGKAEPSIERDILRLDIRGADLPDSPDEDPETGMMCFEASAVYGHFHGKNMVYPQRAKICGNLNHKLKNVFKVYNTIKKIKMHSAKKKHRKSQLARK